MIGSAAPETGDTWLIGSFAVAIIGGTGLNGGSISLPGYFLGGAIFILIQNGLIDIKANPYFASSFLGGLILLAIVLDRVREIVSAKRNSSQDSKTWPGVTVALNEAHATFASVKISSVFVPFVT